MSFSSRLNLSLRWTIAGCLLLIAAGLPATSAAIAKHPFHVSLTEIEFNSKTGKFEVALCVWPLDVEQALRKQEGRPVDLQKEGDLDQLLKTYVEQHFRVRPANSIADASTDSEKSNATKVGETISKSDGKQSADEQNAGNANNDSSENDAESDTSEKLKAGQVRWVGHQGDLKKMWLYFEVQGKPDQVEWTIENRVFFELNDDQQNHVQWTIDRDYETFVCSREESKQTFSTTRLLRSDSKIERRDRH